MTMLRVSTVDATTTTAATCTTTKPFLAMQIRVIDEWIIGHFHILFRVDYLLEIHPTNLGEWFARPSSAQRIMFRRNRQLSQRRLLRRTCQLIHVILIIHIIARSIARPKTRRLIIRRRRQDMTHRMPRKIPNNLLVRFMNLGLALIVHVRIAHHKIFDIAALATRHKQLLVVRMPRQRTQLVNVRADRIILAFLQHAQVPNLDELILAARQQPIAIDAVEFDARHGVLVAVQ